MGTLTLDAFKDAVRNNNELKERLSGLSDTIDFDNGTATIHKENINKYLEKYSCKDESDLTDTLWYNYGMFVRIV
ncbi:MAG: hypothetical protein J6X18_05545 [Bacteroidales bacterium]|nr:hypothetical protein [Bacteroidales bacterium]